MKLIAWVPPNRRLQPTAYGARDRGDFTNRVRASAAAKAQLVGRLTQSHRLCNQIFSSPTMKLQQLLNDLHTADYKTRRNAIEEIAKIHDKRVVPSLSSIIHDEDWSLQKAAIKALGELGDSDAVPPLIEVVLGDDEWVAEAAAEALGMIGDVRAIPSLLHVLASEHLLRQFDALLERKNGRTDSETLVLLGQTYFDISDLRSAAACALGRIGNQQVVPNLIAALNDPHDKYVQLAAAQALEQIATDEAIHAVAVWRHQQPVEEDRSQTSDSPPNTAL